MYRSCIALYSLVVSSSVRSIGVICWSWLKRVVWILPSSSLIDSAMNRLMKHINYLLIRRMNVSKSSYIRTMDYNGRENTNIYSNKQHQHNRPLRPEFQYREGREMRRMKKREYCSLCAAHLLFIVYSSCISHTLLESTSVLKELLGSSCFCQCIAVECLYMHTPDVM